MDAQATNPFARVLTREVFIPATGPYTVHAGTFYTHPSAPHLLGTHALEYRDDTNALIVLRRSEDEARTWEPLGELSGCEPAEGGGFP